MTVDQLEQEIGQRVFHYRTNSGLSQKAIAEAMQASGHAKWSQSTAWAVEQGTRPLRLSEAIGLAEALGIAARDLARDMRGTKDLHREHALMLRTLREIAHDISTVVGD